MALANLWEVVVYYVGILENGVRGADAQCV